MFGFSFSEVVLIGVVTLIAVGPQRLPGMLRNFGQWMRKLRKMTTEVRQQTGIDDMLRAEGLHGGLNELRSLMRGGGPLAAAAVAAPAPMRYQPPEDPYHQIEVDVSREYPSEGADAKGALPDDLTAPDEPPPVVEAVPVAEVFPIAAAVPVAAVVPVSDAVAANASTEPGGDKPQGDNGANGSGAGGTASTPS